MNCLLRIVGAVVLCLGLAAGSALAAGGGSRSPPKNKDFARGAALVEDGKFAEALPLLQKAVAAEPKNADAYNYLGYSHRKLGDKQAAFAFYQKALDIKPKHRGANEYLGELYLEMGNLKKAEERLKVLDKACFFGCEEYTDLKNAIKAYKADHNS